MSQGNNRESKEFVAILVTGENWRFIKEIAKGEVDAISLMTMRSSKPMDYETYREARGMILGIEQLIHRIEDIGNKYSKEKRDGRES